MFDCLVDCLFVCLTPGHGQPTKRSGPHIPGMSYTSPFGLPGNAANHKRESSPNIGSSNARFAFPSVLKTVAYKGSLVSPVQKISEELLIEGKSGFWAHSFSTSTLHPSEVTSKLKERVVVVVAVTVVTVAVLDVRVLVVAVLDVYVVVLK